MGIQLKFNATGLAPVSPIIDLPNGAAKVKIVSIKEEPNKEGSGKNAVFDCSVDEGPMKGAPVRIYIGCDITNEFLRRQWVTAILSMGAPADKVLKPELDFNTDSFIGKTGHIFNQKKTGDQKYDNRSFVTPEMYAQLPKMEASPAGATATGAQTAAASAPASSNGTTTAQPAAAASSLQF